MAGELGAEFLEYACRTEEETIDAVAGAAVVFVNFAPITRAVIEQLPVGATIIRYGIGYDNVDIAAATAAGVRVCNVPDYGADTVADHAVAGMLAAQRRLVPFTERLRRGEWLTAAAAGPIRGFSDTTVGLIGTGRIGIAVAKRLTPFGFGIVAHDPFVDDERLQAVGIEPVSLEQLFRRSHVVSLHMPLTPDSRHLIGSDALALMRDDAILVNTSRGGLVDEDALGAALRDGRLGGAVLDVFGTEPLSPSSELRSFENVILTPHAAFYSETSLAALQRLAAEEGARALRGEALRCQVA